MIEGLGVRKEVTIKKTWLASSDPHPPKNIKKTQTHENVKKPLRCFTKIDKTSCIFSENPCAKMQKTQKSEKTISFYSENVHRNRF